MNIKLLDILHLRCATSALQPNQQTHHSNNLISRIDPQTQKPIIAFFYGKPSADHSQVDLLTYYRYRLHKILLNLESSYSRHVRLHYQLLRLLKLYRPGYALCQDLTRRKPKNQMPKSTT